MMLRMRSVAASGARVKPAAAGIFQGIHQVDGEGFDAQRGQGNGEVAPGETLADRLDQLDDMRIVGGGQGEQADFFVAGIGQSLLDGLEDLVDRALAHRSADHAGMAETAAAGAAADDLDRHAVVDGIDVGDDEMGGGGRELADDALEHGQGRLRDQLLEALKRAIGVIVRLVERGDVNAPDLGE